jgi:hypothetical protein
VHLDFAYFRRLLLGRRDLSLFDVGSSHVKGVLWLVDNFSRRRDYDVSFLDE